MKLPWRPPALVAVAVLVLAACTGGGNSDKDADRDPGRGDRSATAATQASAPAPEPTATFAVITHGASGDAFWDVVHRGAEQAGKDLGVAVTYRGASQAGEQANLIDAAVADKVDGLVVSMAEPDALAAPIGKAVAAGIPVVTINAGQDRSAGLGALAHVGQDDTVAGQGAGTRLAGVGVKKLLCVIHESSDTDLERRCAGAKQTLASGTTENLRVDASTIAQARATIATKLQQDTSIDGVLALHPTVAMAAVEAVASSGSKAKVATFDLSDAVIDAIDAGKISFAVDQQQYQQGYLPVVMLHLYLTNANTVGGGRPVFTGPGFVTKENAARVKALAAEGTR